MKEALKKAIIPSCIFALLGIPFALVGGIVFFVLGLIIFTMVFYVYGRVKHKEKLSEADTIEMCKQFLVKTTHTINEQNEQFSPLKFGIFTLDFTIYDEIDNALIYRMEYDSEDDIKDVIEEYRKNLLNFLEKKQYKESREYIACVYVQANFIAQIQNRKNGESSQMILTYEEMKSILSKWYFFDTEYSWL